MKLAVRRTSAVIATMATAGVSSLFMGVAPAVAAGTDACGTAGTLVAPGICEQVFTSGSATFTATADMTKLEALLVGAGGVGTQQTMSNMTGYAAGGGGGEVKIVDFSGSTGPLALTVADAANAGTVSGFSSATAGNGADGYADASGDSIGGSSGNSNLGATTDLAGGGGAGSAATDLNGGAGVVVSALAPSGSLFTGDTRCYGGGGAASFSGTPDIPTNPFPVLPAQPGIPGCGGGGPTDATATALMAPIANSGGGGGALNLPQTLEARAGASGVVVIRWTAANITLAFDVNGHGTSPADQSIVPGTAPVEPADPTEAGYVFEGWFADAALTVPVNFAAPLTEAQTFHAKWSEVLPVTDATEVLPVTDATEVLAVTGGAPNQAPLWIGAGSLLAGAGLVTIAYLRKRKAN